jgi:hypothetical protein
MLARQNYQMVLITDNFYGMKPNIFAQSVRDFILKRVKLFFYSKRKVNAANVQDLLTE